MTPVNSQLVDEPVLKSPPGIKKINSLKGFSNDPHNAEGTLSLKMLDPEKRNTPSIWMLTTYPPKECGIATFSHDLRRAIEQVFGGSIHINIAAIDTKNENREYSKEVGYIFNPANAHSYTDFARLININSQTEALIIQHEFGLFPEESHEHFLEMLSEIKKPVILVMHTVMPSCTPLLRKKTVDLISAVTRVIVMTRHSANILRDDYHVSGKKIEVIQHGTHLLGHLQKNDLKEKFELKNRTVLSTFGLISRNKNIETSLKALPSVIKKYPDVIFLVLGRIHPEVFKKEGDAYRRELEKIVNDNGLKAHVKFIERYLSLQELLEYLKVTDIYLFTSKDPAQAVSGTFSYALSAGCAIVSSPIPHARELLESGGGLLFDFENPASLATQILRYLDEPGFREEICQKALEAMADTAWENVAIRYLTALNEVCRQKLPVPYKIPEIKTDHLETLTTGLGIIQFARYSQPDIASGYTLDDNARALVVAAMLHRQTASHKSLQLVEKYLDFITNCQLPDGSFFNYCNEDGACSDENVKANLEDSNGRAIWALGYVANMKKTVPEAVAVQAENLLLKAAPNFESIQSPRAIAFILKGLYYYHNAKPSDHSLSLIESLAEKLAALYKHCADEEWKWFEPYLTYANSVLPEAMLVAYQVTHKVIYDKIARESFGFLLSKTFPGNQIKVISNKSWLHKGNIPASHGEQPIDVAYTILALDRFYNVYKNQDYVAKLKTAFSWFLGENHLKRIIYNPATGGCFDGLEQNTVNLNQGAESTLSYLLARLTISKYKEE